jgi:hypothetical protein
VQQWVEGIYNEPLQGEMKRKTAPIRDDEQDSGFMSLMAEAAGGA